MSAGGPGGTGKRRCARCRRVEFARRWPPRRRGRVGRRGRGFPSTQAPGLCPRGGRRARARGRWCRRRRPERCRRWAVARVRRGRRDHRRYECRRERPRDGRGVEGRQRGAEFIAPKPGDERADADRGEDATDRAFPRFLRTDLRSHLVFADGEAGKQCADIAEFRDSDEPQAQHQTPVRRNRVCGQRREDAHHVLEEQRDVDQTEERGGERLDAFFGWTLSDDADRDDNRGESEQRMGGRAETSLDVGRERDQSTEEHPESAKWRPTGGRHQLIKLAKCQHGDRSDKNDASGGAEKPQRDEYESPKSEGAKNT